MIIHKSELKSFDYRDTSKYMKIRTIFMRSRHLLIIWIDIVVLCLAGDKLLNKSSQNDIRYVSPSIRSREMIRYNFVCMSRARGPLFFKQGYPDTLCHSQEGRSILKLQKHEFPDLIVHWHNRWATRLVQTKLTHSKLLHNSRILSKSGNKNQNGYLLVLPRLSVIFLLSISMITFFSPRNLASIMVN